MPTCVDLRTPLFGGFRKRQFRRKLVVSTENGKTFPTADTTLESIKETTLLLETQSPTGRHFNPYLTNGFSHHYQLDESTFIFRGVGSDIYFYLIFR